MKKVLIGMSGGVDSTVSAAILKERGFYVCGITFIMHDSQLGIEKEAAAAAAQAGVDFVYEDYREFFKAKVCDTFASEYMSGRTPNPCVTCNREIKFPGLLKYADMHGFDFIATGHYASVVETDGKYSICAPADSLKDQTYFLYHLGQDVLSRLIFPLSGMTKNEVREYAASHGFSSASKSDSQDICFIPDGETGKFLSEKYPNAGGPGNFTDSEGKILGRHEGIFRYTVGQRRGLGVSADARLFVTEIIPSENRIVLGKEEVLGRKTVFIKECVFSSGTIPDGPFEADVRLRYTKRPSKAKITPHADGTCTAEFDLPQRSPAPGQAAVFYENGKILGGGIIASSEK